jgi:hypothetical protein
MAVAHAAGVAALFAQNAPAMPMSELLDAVLNNAMPIDGSPLDVGAGLVYVR